MGSCLSIDGQTCSPYASASPIKRLTRNNSILKKKEGSGSGSFDPRMEMSLHRVPNRFFLNEATNSSCLFTKQGERGVNQDAMVVWENFGPDEDTILCGVFDGHGPNGQLVAKKVRDCLPLELGIQLEDELTQPADTRSRGYHPLKVSLLRAFKVIDQELRFKFSDDCYGSGTTAMVMLKQGNEVVIGNLGDSRAVLGSRGSKCDSLIATQLTVDLNANLPSLAMTRAFGDFCIRGYGLISIPEISYRCLSRADEFIILATDGVWDVISNEEAVDIVASAPQEGAARALVETARRSWKVKCPCVKVDDCTVVCLFLDSGHSTYYSIKIY